LLGILFLSASSSPIALYSIVAASFANAGVSIYALKRITSDRGPSSTVLSRLFYSYAGLSIASLAYLCLYIMSILISAAWAAKPLSPDRAAELAIAPLSAPAVLLSIPAIFTLIEPHTIRIPLIALSVIIYTIFLASATLGKTAPGSLKLALISVPLYVVMWISDIAALA